MSSAPIYQDLSETVWLATGDQGSLGQPWQHRCVFVHMCLCENVCGSQRSGAVASGSCIPRCQQLQKLEFRGSYWAVQVSETSCWRDPQCKYMYRCALYTYVCWECNFSPTTGHTWAMELQYLQLSRAVKYGWCIFLLIISTTVINVKLNLYMSGLLSWAWNRVSWRQLTKKLRFGTLSTGIVSTFTYAKEKQNVHLMGEGGGTREREREGRSCTEKPNLSTSIYMLKGQMFKKKKKQFKKRHYSRI